MLESFETKDVRIILSKYNAFQQKHPIMCMYIIGVNQDEATLAAVLAKCSTVPICVNKVSCSQRRVQSVLEGQKFLECPCGVNACPIASEIMA